MTSHSTAIYTPFADGRTVRDIVEHSPALVTEAWCRQLLRQVLQSLEQQYASGAPHRPITPDSLVVLENGEALLLPASDAPDAPAEVSVAADLHALALVVHYAISAELPPEGPLGPRLYDDYSDNLTQTIDRCLGPNQRLRPKTIDELRTMLGMQAETMVAPAGAGAAEEALPPLPDLQPDLQPNVQREPQRDLQPAPAQPDAGATEAQAAREAGREAAARLPAFAGAAVALEKAVAPGRQAAHDEAHHDSIPVMAAAAEPDRFGRAAPAATPLKPSSDAAPAAAGTRPAAQPPVARTGGGLERWAMIAGAAVVLLAAGGALYTHLNEDNSADVVALSLPPQERAARGLDAGEAVVTPATAGATPAAADAGAGVAGDTQPAGLATAADATGLAAPAGAGAVPAPAAPAAGRQAEAVVNGTTYKLLIKPWGTVYVNGVDRGVSPPVKRLTLAQGQHTIRIVNPNFAEHVMTVNAGGAESATIEHDFTAKAEGGRQP